MIEAVQVPVRSRVWTQEDAKQAYELLSADPPQSVKFGEYDKEGQARTQGAGLSRMIGQLFGSRYGCTVWKNQEGKFVGALEPRPPHTRTVKAKGTGRKS